MRTRSINPGDIVRVNKRGRIFHAHVRGVSHGGLTIEPLERGISYRQVSPREVIDHWAHNLSTRREDRPDPGQARLELGDT